LEKTQRDKDEDAFGRWLNAVRYMPTPTGDVWHAACDYARKDEREQVAKMLPDPLRKSPLSLGETYDMIKAIHARCEGRGQ
jgi:hypothetical protein